MQPRDLWRLLGFLLAGLLVGIAIGMPGWALFAAAMAYLALLHADLERLLAWLRQHKTHEPPERPGVFEELTLEVDYLRERHKKRKKKLANYLKQFQQATRALPDATIVLDTNDEVRWANGAAARDLGVRWPDDVGQRITNLVREPRLRAFVAESPEATSDTIQIESPMNAERQLSILTAPYGNDQRILVARDITQLHRANQVRSDFVANVSHELRTPITVFRGYLENLRERRAECPPGWEPALEQMTLQADRMRSLVEELLMLSSLESEERVPDPTEVDVAGLIAEIQERARELSGSKEHFFSLEVDGDLRISGSRHELYSAFSNLVFNAVQYTAARGIIRICWSRDEHGAHFVVEDNGVGIAEEHLSRLTERFYRVDSSRRRTDDAGGTGLGLAIVKHVLARHGATLQVHSVLGKGSIFSADFPPDAVVDDTAANQSSVRGTG